jgi:hypothetical protein
MAVEQLAGNQIDAPGSEQDGLWPGDERAHSGWMGGPLITSAWASMALALHVAIEQRLDKPKRE